MIAGPVIATGNKRLLGLRRLVRKFEEYRRHRSRFGRGKIGRIGSRGTIHPVRSQGMLRGFRIALIEIRVSTPHSQR